MTKTPFFTHISSIAPKLSSLRRMDETVTKTKVQDPTAEAPGEPDWMEAMQCLLTRLEEYKEEEDTKDSEEECKEVFESHFAFGSSVIFYCMRRLTS